MDKTMKTTCCGYEVKDGEIGPVHANPSNGVVQCHNCGAVYSKRPFPERDETRPAEQQGLFRKFDVRRVDGSDSLGGKHDGCRYFVLDINHDAHAPAALRAYAASCKDTHPQLSADLVAEFGAQQEQPPIKTWQERCDWTSGEPATKLMVEAMKAEIAELRANAQPPAGYVLVPAYPDQRMINAFIAEYERPGGSECGCYRAMLAAAPKP